MHQGMLWWLIDTARCRDGLNRRMPNNRRASRSLAANLSSTAAVIERGPEGRGRSKRGKQEPETRPGRGGQLKGKILQAPGWQDHNYGGVGGTTSLGGQSTGAHFGVNRCTRPTHS